MVKIERIEMINKINHGIDVRTESEIDEHGDIDFDHLHLREDDVYELKSNFITGITLSYALKNNLYIDKIKENIPKFINGIIDFYHLCEEKQLEDISENNIIVDENGNLINIDVSFRDMNDFSLINLHQYIIQILFNFAKKEIKEYLGDDWQEFMRLVIENL